MKIGSTQVLFCLLAGIHAQPSYGMVELTQQQSSVLKWTVGAVIAVLLTRVGITALRNLTPEATMLSSGSISDGEERRRLSSIQHTQAQPIQSECIKRVQKREATNTLLELSRASIKDDLCSMAGYNVSISSDLYTIGGRAGRRQLQAALLLVDKYHADLEALDRNGYTALMNTIAKGKVEMCNFLLQRDPAAVVRKECPHVLTDRGSDKIGLLAFSQEHLAHQQDKFMKNRRLIKKLKSIVDLVQKTETSIAADRKILAKEVGSVLPNVLSTMVADYAVPGVT